MSELTESHDANGARGLAGEVHVASEACNVASEARGASDENHDAASEDRYVDDCWARRGCDDEMMGRCPHNVPGEPCPADCHYAACLRKTHVVCDDFEILLNPSRDYDMAVKEICRFCEHFLIHGPDIADRPEGFHRQGNPNRFLL